MANLSLRFAGTRPAVEMAAQSRAALDEPLAAPADLWIAVAGDSASIVGAFQRVEVPGQGGLPLVRRGSGGPHVLVGPGTVHVALTLAHPSALMPCDEKRIVNRYVRPLLRALTAKVAPAAFFGRDWISVGKQPASWVGFGHDSATRRTLFEAFVAVSHPFAQPQGTLLRASFRGKVPGTLEAIVGRALDPMALARAVAEAYLEGHVGEPHEMAPAGRGALGTGVVFDPPWAATCEEAIGLIGAGPDAQGVFRVGGDLLVSRDALARLERRAADASDEAIGAIVDETLTAPGIAIDGVRTLSSLREVILNARHASQ